MASLFDFLKFLNIFLTDFRPPPTKTIMKILSHLLPAILLSTSLVGQDNVTIKFGNVSQKALP
jgi:hypothetical protein